MYKEISLIIKNNYKFNTLQIFDNNKKIEEVTALNKYIFKGKINHAYGLKILNNKGIYNTSFYVSSKNNDPYIFDITNKPHKVFIKIIDLNYDLLIKKGEIKLWPSHII